MMGVTLLLSVILLPDFYHVTKDLEENPFRQVTLVFEQDIDVDLPAGGQLNQKMEIGKILPKFLIDKGILRRRESGKVQ
jgi:hypothetical protein